MAELQINLEAKRKQLTEYAEECLAKMRGLLVHEREQAEKFQAEINKIHAEAVKWEGEANRVGAILAFLAVEEEQIDGACSEPCACAASPNVIPMPVAAPAVASEG